MNCGNCSAYYHPFESGLGLDVKITWQKIIVLLLCRQWKYHSDFLQTLNIHTQVSTNYLPKCNYRASLEFLLLHGNASGLQIPTVFTCNYSHTVLVIGRLKSLSSSNIFYILWRIHSNNNCHHKFASQDAPTGLILKLNSFNNKLNQ